MYACPSPLRSGIETDVFNYQTNPVPSSNLVKPHLQRRTDHWLEAIQTTESFYNAIFFLTCPILYPIAIQAIEALRNYEKSQKIRLAASKWPSAFSGISTIINRATPPHRDPQGLHHGYDLLSMGGSARQVRLTLPDLGADFAYGPRTAVLIAGRTLRHSVGEWAGGDRHCRARWLRKGVLEHLGIQPGTWMTRDNLLAHLTNLGPETAMCFV